jgi:hypothetical protein
MDPLSRYDAIIDLDEEDVERIYLPIFDTETSNWPLRKALDTGYEVHVYSELHKKLKW